MFTNNYIKYQDLILNRVEQKNVIHPSGAVTKATTSLLTASNAFFTCGCILVAARTPQCCDIPDIDTCTQFVETVTKAGVYFGQGRTPAKRDDYKLEEPITSGLSFTAPNTPLRSEKDNLVSYDLTYTVKNTSQNVLNISEMGLFITVSKSGSVYNLIMIDRVVKDEPVTILPGEAKQITYTWHSLYPQ